MKRAKLLYAFILIVAAFCSVHALAASKAKPAPTPEVSVSSAGDEMVDALQKGDAKTVAALKAKGVSLDSISSSDGLSGLMRLADDGNLEGVKKALADGAKLDHANADGETALWYATYSGHEDLALMLIEKGAKTDQVLAKNKECVVHSAAKAQLKALSKKLKTTAKKCLSQKNIDGQTPSEIAKGLGNAELAKLLK